MEKVLDNILFSENNNFFPGDDSFHQLKLSRVTLLR